MQHCAGWPSIAFSISFILTIHSGSESIIWNDNYGFANAFAFHTNSFQKPSWEKAAKIMIERSSLLTVYCYCSININKLCTWPFTQFWKWSWYFLWYCSIQNLTWKTLGLDMTRKLMGAFFWGRLIALKKLNCVEGTFLILSFCSSISMTICKYVLLWFRWLLSFYFSVSETIIFMYSY